MTKFYTNYRIVKMKYTIVKIISFSLFFRYVDKQSFLEKFFNK